MRESETMVIDEIFNVLFFLLQILNVNFIYNYFSW